MGTRFTVLLQKIIIIFIIPSLVFAECLTEFHPTSIKNKYAKGFDILKGADFYIIQSQRQKILITNNKKLNCPGYTKISSPVKKIVGLSTTFLPAFEMLDVEHTLVGFPDTKLITTSSIRKRVNSKKIKNLTYPINLEQILMLSPDLIMGYSGGAFEEESLAKLRKLKQVIIYIDDYKETSLLARAEWIKFISIFYDKFELALKIFKKIDADYIKLKKMVENLKRPQIIVGDNKNGIWNAPGGNSYFAALIYDAGGDYLWKEKKTRQTLFMNIEAVWPKILNGDIWLTQNTWFKMDDLIKSDNKYKLLKVVKNKMVYNHILRVNKWKNMNYWETAMMRPDLLLKDLVMIFHPSVLQGQKTLWYDKLK